MGLPCRHIFTVILYRSEMSCYARREHVLNMVDSNRWLQLIPKATAALETSTGLSATDVVADVDSDNIVNPPSRKKVADQKKVMVKRHHSPTTSGVNALFAEMNKLGINFN